MNKKPWLIGALAAVASGLLYFAAFPPLDIAESAYVFAIPLLLWLFTNPSRKRVALCALLGFWVGWFVLIIWLRFVHPPMGLVGLILLSFIMALFPMSWALMGRWLLPPMLSRPFPQRLLALLGMASCWVLIEWLRSWFLTGFPWLPLAASQWQRPAMLQTAEFGGQYAVSFILILFNLGLAVYLHRLFTGFAGVKPAADGDAEDDSSERQRLQLKWRFCPEFYVALSLVFVSVWVYVRRLSEAEQREPMLNIAAVQPWIPADLKWTQEMARESLDVLRQQTQRVVVAEPKPDLLIWPEAALPSPVITASGDRWMEQWISQGISSVNVPLLAGALGHFPNDEWVNGIFYFDPKTGLGEDYYAKRQLVPFGEYIPLRKIIFFIKTVVPLEIDLKPGEDSLPIEINAGGKTWKAGALICYEDIFASLGREVAQDGADFIVVVTNDGWYGEEAGAYQHAAHSVLRAVETRRPVVRCGNHGWSGWIDEYGNVRDVLTGPDGRVYARQSKTFATSYAPEWRGRLTFYAKYGNWVIWLGAVFLAGAILQRCRSRGSPSSEVS